MGDTQRKQILWNWENLHKHRKGWYKDAAPRSNSDHQDYQLLLYFLQRILINLDLLLLLRVKHPKVIDNRM